MRVYSNLKAILEKKNMKIRELERLSGLPFETLRRLYNDDAKQYQRETIGRLCEVLNVEICDLLKLKKEDGEDEH